jgi:hypothetical protein
MSRTHRALNTWTVLATIIILASHSNTSQAEPPVVSERALPVHGPFAVSDAKPSITNGPPRHDLPPPMPPNHGHIEPTPPDEGSPFPAGSPEAEAPVVPERALPIHGPFAVTAAELSAANPGTPGPPDYFPEPSITDGPPRHDLPPPMPPNHGHIEPTPPDEGSPFPAGSPEEPHGPQTPQATSAFVDHAGLGGIDPGIAAGSRYVLVCDDHNGLAVYDKAGKLLGPKAPGHPFPNPLTFDSLFSKVKADIDPQLNYPPGLPPGFKANGIILYGDHRVTFDHYRKRFWIYAMAKNLPHGFWIPDTIMTYPNVKLARRDKAAVAVSVSEDPRDGFLTYWWNNTIHNGESNEPTGNPKDPKFKTSGEGADYPSIAISAKYFLATIGVNRRDPTFKTDTQDSAQAWADCDTSFVEEGQTFNYCGPFYAHLMVVDAHALAEGKPGVPCPDGKSFGLFMDAKNDVTDRTDNGDYYETMGRGVKPVVMHGAPPTGHPADGYFANNFIQRSGTAEKAYMVLWTLLGSSLKPTLYPIRPFTIDNNQDWKFLLNASFRDGNLYATFPDCFRDSQGNCLPAIRAIRVNTVSGKTQVDRTFGRNNPIDDKPTERFAYGFPGIEANKHGDMVFVYTRSSATDKRPQEVRFSVWYHNESDIRPSRLLHAGEAPYAKVDSNTGKHYLDYGTGTDTAGIAVDPSDDEAIWIAQIFAAKDASGQGSNRIAFGKAFGNP